MYSHNEIRSTLDEIFDGRTYRVWINPVDLSLKDDELPEDFDSIKPAPVRDPGWDDLCGQLVATENPMQDELLNAVYNKPRFTQDMDENESIYAKQNLVAHITPAEFATIVARGGEMTLLNIPDALRMHEVISTYMSQVSYRSMWEPHYSEPPSQDMVMFRQAVDIIQPLADNVRRMNAGTTPISQLLHSLRSTATGDLIQIQHEKSNANDEPGVKVSGKTKQLGVDWSFNGGAYDI